MIVKCLVCGVKLDNYTWRYKSYKFPNLSYCPSCHYSMKRFYYYRILDMIESRNDMLKSMTDDEFYHKVTRPIMNNKEVEL